RRVHPRQGEARAADRDRVPRSPAALSRNAADPGQQAKWRFMMPSAQKISPCLWFDREAEEAANHYVSLFPDARIVSLSRYGGAAARPERAAPTVLFELASRRFMALNGGPMFKFSEGVSLMVSCDTQDEIDMFWERLSAGGQPGRCGWLKDKFGLSWQVIPSMLSEIMGGGDAARSNRVMSALMRMSKLDIAGLRAAGQSAAA